MKKVIVNGKEWTQDSVKNLMVVNDSAVIRGMLKIYEYQTAQEKNSLATMEDNGVGFSGVHGNIMSSFSEFYIKNKYLTVKQMVTARKIMLHYSGQLLKIMEAKNEVHA